MLKMTGTPQSHQLARFLAGLQLTDLPPSAPELLKLCLLDTIGCAVGGHNSEAGKVTERYLKRVGNSGSCTVVGSASRAAPEVAALANGVLAHALVFDDLHRHAKLHPGVAVIKPDGARTCIVELGAERLKWIAGYLVELGWDFEVLEPAELREHAAALGRRLSEANGRKSVVGGRRRSVSR